MSWKALHIGRVGNANQSGQSWGSAINSRNKHTYNQSLFSCHSTTFTYGDRKGETWDMSEVWAGLLLVNTVNFYNSSQQTISTNQNWAIGHEPWALSQGPWARSLEPCGTMNWLFNWSSDCVTVARLIYHEITKKCHNYYNPDFGFFRFFWGLQSPFQAL